MQRKWADPEYRARVAAGQAKANKRKQENPKANWRYGIPDGMRREEAEAEWAFARMYAKEVTKIMIEKEQIPDDPKVTKAFEAAVEVLESPMSQAIKLQAARLLLDFLKAKPAQKNEVTVKNAEDWLAQVINDDGPEASS